MANRDLVAIGASAGGVRAVAALVGALPKDFPAAILLTQHLSPTSRSILDRILGEAGPLPARFATDGQPLIKGEITIAGPGRHLMIDGDRVLLGRGPRENNARPAIDPMFRSVALCCGHRAIGVVLTGTMGDGASGLHALGQCGGITVVQDPKDAEFPEMPLTAMVRSAPYYVMPLAEMPALLERLVHQPAAAPVAASKSLETETAIARGRQLAIEDMDQIGRRSVLTCPDCGGVMWEMNDDVPRYRCHVGHAYHIEPMNRAQQHSIHTALATAMRTLRERAVAVEKLRQQAIARGQHRASQHWTQVRDEILGEAEVIRQAIERADAPPSE
ncbi:MAG: chemotaxis protein CheB [Hyphomicrobiales bacterium]|nr:chemotaxis protein CheB [Hyphomicrobiales bacterium]